jgi:ATP-binding cassette subfamily B protein
MRIAFKEAPYYTFHQCIGYSRHCIIVFIEHIYMIGYIINAIQNKTPFRDVFWFILCVFIWVVLWANVWENFFNFKIKPKAEEKIKKRIRLELYKNASVIDLQCYDDPVFYNDFVWAMGEADSRVFAVIDSTSRTLGSIINVAMISGYMLSQDKIGLFFVLLSFIGIFHISKKINKLQLKINERMKPYQRKRDYIKRVLYLSEYAKEIRISNVKQKLYEDFNQAVKDLKAEADKDTRLLAFYHFLTDFVFNTLLLEGAYLFYLLWRSIVLKNIGYGTAITLFRSCDSVRNGLMNLSSTVPKFQEHSLYIDKIRQFLNYEVKITESKRVAVLPETGNLTMNRISFGYGVDKVLKNIELSIHKGEKIALVGYNGAGKTTLIKLLLRLYDVSEGEIRYGANNIVDYSIKEYRNKYNTVFQDYQLFAATLASNIVMDNKPLEQSRAEKAVIEGGFIEKLTDLENGFETQVTKEFDNDGLLLSGGEAQKLVISRALYKNSPIIIMDEPSSALDPIAEYHLNQTMMTLDPDKTVIIISHRLSTTKLCDKIYMLEAGEIVEEGTHNELMEMNGKYAFMFNLQAEKYHKAFQ